MGQQFDIIFPIHTDENNDESQRNLEENKARFSDQCVKIYKYLMSGKRMNGDDANDLFSIKHLPRRRKDLTDNGVLLSDEWKKGMKELFMTPEQIKANRENLALILLNNEC